MFYLFLREKQSTSRGEAEREGDIESKVVSRGAWVAQSVEHPTSAQVSGHDLAVRGLEPRPGLCVDSSEPGAFFGSRVSLSVLSLPCSHSVSLRLKNK